MKRIVEYEDIKHVLSENVVREKYLNILEISRHIKFNKIYFYYNYSLSALIYMILVNLYAFYVYCQCVFFFQGTKNIEGMFLNNTTAEPIQLPAEAFKKMNRLRLLKVGSDMIQLSQDFELPCRKLTYIDWNGYDLEFMPSNFHVDNLVELHFQNSYIRHLWEGNMVFLLFSFIFALD